jgi:Polysaccharide lyase
VRLGSFDCGCLDHSTYYYTPGQFVPGHVFPTADPDGSGKQVAAFAIANSDQPYTGAPPRGDLFFQVPLRPGSDVYISIPVRIPAGLPLEQDDASKFFQWAQLDYPGAPGPSLGLDIAANGDDHNHYDLGIRASPETPWVGPRVDGRWHTAILHVHVQPDDAGFVELWWDGVPQTFTDGTTTWYAPTINRNQNGDYIEELDIDEYRSRNSMPGTVTIYHGAPAIGPTLASVARTVAGGRGP